uniref:Importin subunit beta-1/Transportin-1-like TPR repeats domain-containing protein n=1 Tax=Alexandrium catenella TaxID=2925 RepID=A0A7S1RN32_ALECA
MAIAQVVEHITENAWVDQCVDFIAQNLTHQHPRVRFSAFVAVGQVAFDHVPHVQETHHALLLPAIVVGIKDVYIRVAAEAVNAFTSLADELDCEDLEPFMEDLLTGMFLRLGQGETKAMQESCLSGIAAVAQLMEEDFLPYYSSVVPALKQIIANATSEKDRSLRGKAFECVSLVGSVVGKETFAEDAHEVMKVMAQMVQSGFAADDPQQESVRDASGKIAEALGKDFKPYVSALLPVLFQTLKNRPTEVDPNDMPDDYDSDDEHPDMSLTVVDGKVLGLKTSVIEEMGDCLGLIRVFISSLEEEFCEFLPPTCQNMLPLLDLQLSEALQAKAFRTWEALVECARNGVDRGCISAATLQELVTVFLEKTIGALRDSAASQKPDESALQAKVVGVSGVIRKAGNGILTGDGVKNIASIAGQLLSSIQVSKDQESSTEDAMHRRKGRASSEDDEDEDDEEGAAATPQSLRFALADVAGALMHTSGDAFAEVALPTFMQFVQSLLKEGASDHDRGLAFYITDDVVNYLGLKSVPYWNGFMTLALQGMSDKDATVREYAASTIGNAAQQQIFAQMAPAAASQLVKLLQKNGERHRRRKAVKAEAKQAALAVDAAIRALGDIGEHHTAALGEHAGKVWGMWLSNLPLKYDEEAGQRTSAQLLRLMSQGHPAVTSAEQLPQVVTILAEVYKTKFSSTEIDKNIFAALASIGEAPLKQIGSGLQEKVQRKIEHILHDGAKAAA